MMTKRLDAAKAGETKYNTGKPCKRGHSSDRYVRNGACLQCLQAANTALNETAQLAPNPRREALSRLVRMGMRLFHTDVPKFTDVAVALVLARYPNLTRLDVIAGRATGVAAGTGFYPFNVHPEDVQMLRDVATAYRSAHWVDHAGVIAARLATAAEAAAKERDNGAGEWKFT